MTFQVSFQNPYPDSSIKSFLEEQLLLPRKIRHLLRIKKHITVNDQEVHWHNPIKQGDRVRLIFDSEDYPTKSLKAGNASLVECLYEDDHFIIVNKPEGIKTHANQPDEIALLNHVSSYVGQTCYVVHRLDKETSGVLLFAKNPFILPLINRQLESKTLQRDYWAVVAGHFPKKVTYSDKIGRDRHDRRKRCIDPRKGQTAYTTVKWLKRLEANSLVNCQLKTGRTHQIRVHLSHHGFPIIGDPLYQMPKQHQRLMLHAHRLTLVHPLTLKTITAVATSASFEKLLATKKQR